MGKHKEVLTTGQVAKICNVAPRTVSKWFDSGQLRGYRIPGSKDRRIPIANLVRFMRAHKMPLDGLDTGNIDVVIIDADQQLAGLVKRTLEADGQCDVRIAGNVFEGGMMIGQQPPDVVLVDVTPGTSDAHQIAQIARSFPDLNGIKLIATGQFDDGGGHSLKQIGFDATLIKPFEARELLDLVEQTAGVS